MYGLVSACVPQTINGEKPVLCEVLCSLFVLSLLSLVLISETGGLDQVSPLESCRRPRHGAADS